MRHDMTKHQSVALRKRDGMDNQKHAGSNQSAGMIPYPLSRTHQDNQVAERDINETMRRIFERDYDWGA